MLSDAPFESPASLIAQARRGGRIAMALAGAENTVALEGARRAFEEELITPWLVGDPAAIGRAAEAIAWDIAGLPLVAAEGEAETARLAVALARSGEVGALMKGQIHTDQLMRAVVNREQGLRTDRRLSHLFLLSFPGSDRSLAITDAAINVAPNVDQRLDIAGNAVQLYHALGVGRPKVAVLSATDTPIPAMPSSQEAEEIARRAMAGEIPDAEVAGPLAIDLAISPRAAEIKGVKNAVTGQADILLVPNIETGNALYKALVYFRSATAAGLVLGARVPIVLTSRADPPEARLGAAALAAIAS